MSTDSGGVLWKGTRGGRSPLLVGRKRVYISRLAGAVVAVFVGFVPDSRGVLWEGTRAGSPVSREAGPPGDERGRQEGSGGAAKGVLGDAGGEVRVCVCLCLYVPCAMSVFVCACGRACYVPGHFQH